MFLHGLYMSSCFRFVPCASALASLDDGLQPISQLHLFLPTFVLVSVVSSQQKAESKPEHPDLISPGLFQLNYSHVFSGSYSLYKTHIVFFHSPSAAASCFFHFEMAGLVRVTGVCAHLRIRVLNYNSRRHRGPCTHR